MRFRKAEKEPSFNKVLAAAEEWTGFRHEEMRGPCRDAPLAHARFGVMVALRNAGFSFHDIGDALDRDHSTIIHGIRRAKQLRRIDSEYDAYIGELGRAIG